MTSKRNQVIRVLQGGLSDSSYLEKYNSDDMRCPYCQSEDALLDRVEVLPGPGIEYTVKRDWDFMHCETCEKRWIGVCFEYDKYAHEFLRLRKWRPRRSKRFESSPEENPTPTS